MSTPSTTRASEDEFHDAREESIYEAHQNCSIPISATINEHNAERLANLRFESPGHTPNSNGEADDYHGSLANDRHQSKSALSEQYSIWLDSMPKWTDGLGDGWQGTKFLGRGGNGVTGLWEYTKEQPVQGQRRRPGMIPQRREKRQVSQIVVKQQRALQNGGLMDEGDTLKGLGAAESEHIPKMYKRVYRDAGSGTPGMRIDSDRREVHRMFMEYCSGGDMNGLIRKCTKQGPQENEWKFLREDACWSIFDCLVRAFYAIEFGTEDINMADTIEDWGWAGLVHFDLKPQNVFLDVKDHESHNQIPIHKVGDYGLAMVTPVVQSRRLLDHHRLRGTRFCLAPEQENQSRKVTVPHEVPFLREVVQNLPLPLDQRRYGPHTNIYQIGTCMFSLLTLQPYFPEKTVTYISTLSEELSRGLTVGEDLELGIYAVPYARRDASNNPLPNRDVSFPERIPTPYSKSLKALVLQCLMQDYRNRPSLDELRTEISRCRIIAENEVYNGENDGDYADVGESYPVLRYDAPEIVTPDGWETYTPEQYWRHGVSRHGQNLQPLPSVVRVQQHDARRKEQANRAISFLNKRNNPPRMYDDMEDAEGDDEDAENLDRHGRPIVGDEHNRTRRTKLTSSTEIMAPKKRAAEQSDNASGDAEDHGGGKRRRLVVQDPRDRLFIITLRIFNRASDAVSAPTIAKTQAHFLSTVKTALMHLEQAGKLPYPAVEARVQRTGPLTYITSLDHNLTLEEAAQPSRKEGSQTYRAALDIYSSLEPPPPELNAPPERTWYRAPTTRRYKGHIPDRGPTGAFNRPPSARAGPARPFKPLIGRSRIATGGLWAQRTGPKFIPGVASPSVQMDSVSGGHEDSGELVEDAAMTDFDDEGEDDVGVQHLYM